MSFEEARAKFDETSEEEDVAEKRYLMFLSFQELLDEMDKNSVSDLDGFDGFLYKNSQEFLTSSSTFQKEKKLEKIMDYFERKYVD